MPTKKKIFCIVFMLVGLLLDSSVLPFTGLNMSYVPRVCLVNIVTIAIIMGATQGIIYGAAGGILLDITVYQPTGVISVVYTVLGAVAGFLTHRVKPALVTIVPTLVAFVLFEASMLVYYYFNAGVFPAARILPALARVGISFTLVQLLYIPCIRFLAPAHIGKIRK